MGSVFRKYDKKSKLSLTNIDTKLYKFRREIMPTYQYKCKSCEKEFEIFQHMYDTPILSCPTCDGKVFRIISFSFSVVTPRTLGGLADKNSSAISDDQKEELARKNKTQKTESIYKELPKGMSRTTETARPEDCWYKEGQKVPSKKLARMSEKQKRKYIMTGEI
jgi:putative FmdB family regulatory protein